MKIGTIFNMLRRLLGSYEPVSANPAPEIPSLQINKPNLMFVENAPVSALAPTVVASPDRGDLTEVGLRIEASGVRYRFPGSAHCRRRAHRRLHLPA